MPYIETTAADRYTADASERLKSRMHDGWRRAYARQNQMLPYAGTSLTSGELEMLCRHLDAQLSDAIGPSGAPAALLSAIMTTGRSAAFFADLPYPSGGGRLVWVGIERS